VLVEWLGSELTTTPTRTVTTHLGAFQIHSETRIDGRLYNHSHWHQDL
jgi:hypothetical protein